MVCFAQKLAFALLAEAVNTPPGTYLSARERTWSPGTRVSQQRSDFTFPPNTLSPFALSSRDLSPKCRAWPLRWWPEGGAGCVGELWALGGAEDGVKVVVDAS